MASQKPPQKSKKKAANAPRKSQLTGNYEVGYGKPPTATQFPKGVSGNPSGRPKLLGESYRDWLAKLNANGMTNAEAVALAMGIEAMKGDVSAAREIRAATEGEKLEGLGEVVFRVIYGNGTDDSAPRSG